MRYLVFIIALFAAVQTNAQNNIVYGAGINYTNGAPTFTPAVRTSRVAIDTVTGRWYHFNTPGGWQWIGNTVEEIAGCAAPAYTPSKGDSRLVINNCAKPQVYWYDGLTWKWINEGTTYFPGEGIRIENDTIILDSLYVLRFRTGDTTDLNAGAVSWNAAEQTLDVVINQGTVTGQMFQEVLYFTKNQTGSQIDDGTVVMAAGTTGNSGKILIAPAIADGSVNSEYILGLATQNLPNGGEGMVTHFGKVRGIQTNGANYGETWVDGDVLYCSAATPGYLTKVLPTAPNLKIPIAIVIHAHPSNGTLFVRPSHFPDLAQINDVQLSSPTNGQVLTYNSTLSRWENATPASQLQTLLTDNTPGNISISSGNTITLNVNDADASATNELQTLSTGTNTLTLSNGGGTVTVDTNPSDDVTGSGANEQVSYWSGTQTQTGSSSLTYSTAGNGRLFVGTAYGGGKLNLTQAGDNFFYQNTFNSTAGTSNYWFARKSASNTVGTVTETTDGHFLGALYFQGVDNTNAFEYGSEIVARQLGASGAFVPGSLLIRTYSSTGANANQLFLHPNSNIGISTATPAARLHVVGSGTSSSTWTAQFHNSAGNNNALMIRDDGNVGIGTSSPGARLQINTTGTTTGLALNVLNNSSQTGLSVADNGEVVIGYATGLRLGANRNSIGGIFSSGTSGQESVIFRSNAVPTVTNFVDVSFTNGQGDIAITSGTRSLTAIDRGFNPTSGNGIYNLLRIGGTINQTGTATGITRGILIGPSISSAFDYRAIEYSNNSGWGIYGAGTAKSYFAGNVAIGTTAQNASAAFEVASTTQGLLFPRMTTAQRDLIATPADGLVIYNTTGNKLQVRAAGAWVDLH